VKHIAGRSDGAQSQISAIDASNDVDLGHLIAAVWRRRWSAVTLFAAFMGLSLLIVDILTPKYTAELAMALNMKQDTGGPAGNLSGGIVSKDTEEIATSINTITSPGTVRQIITRLNLQNDPEFDPIVAKPAGGLLTRLGLAGFLPSGLSSVLSGPSAAPVALSPEYLVGNTVPNVSKRLSVTNDGKSYTISISFTALEPDKAAMIANAFGEWYVQHRKDWRSHQLDQISRLLMEKSDALRQHVVESEAAVDAYRQKHGIVSLGNENTLNVDALTKLNTELIAARSAESEAEASLREIERFAADESPQAAAQVVGNAPNLVTLVDQQNQIKAQLASLSRHLLDSHPTVVSLKSRLDEVEAQVKTETGRVLAGLRARLQVARNNEAQIEAGMERLTALNQQSAQAGSELTELESQRDAARAVYQTYLEGAGRAGVEASAQAFDVEITSPAVAPLWPSFPRRELILSLSAACALMLAAALAVVLDSLRRGIHTAEEVATSRNVRVLGVVPQSTKRLVARDPSLSTQVITEPLGAYAEAIRSIGVSLLTGPSVADNKVVLVTSALPGEGKTTLVLSLGRLAAAAGKTVLVMECDLRRPSLLRTLPDPGVGLVDVLNDTVTLHDAIQTDPASGLRYLCAGAKALYPAELLNSEAMNAVLDAVRSSFDLVLIDTPPIGIVSDALVLSTRSDATIVVLRQGKTDKRAYFMTLDRLWQAGAAVTGVVLSRAPPAECLKYCSKREIRGYFAAPG
jgi:capsular exopolysaccharide synthesis family protein